jgi:hypothetical protein
MNLLPSEHEVQCSDCPNVFLCTNPHEPEIHERRRNSGFHDRCPSCALVARARFYATLPPLTGHPMREPADERRYDPDDEGEFGGGVGGHATFAPRR